MLDGFIGEYLHNYRSYKDRWNYEDGCVLKGAWDMYRSTGIEGYKDFVLRYIDEFIDEDGNIKGYDPKKHHLDDINSGKVAPDK